jgi:biopolymer transport protein ExbD
MSGGGGGEEGEFGMQIAPLLDVLFVLLLFFMVSAGAQVRENELGIKIPAKGAAMPGTAETPVTVDLDDNGQVFFNQMPVDSPNNSELPELKSRLQDIIAKFGETQPVIVAPVKTARHQRVVDVLNACSAARVRNLAFGASSL